MTFIKSTITQLSSSILILTCILSFTRISSQNKDIDKKIESMLSQLTLEEKVAMCHAQSKFSTKGAERLGIPEIWMSDGPHGVRAEIRKTENSSKKYFIVDIGEIESFDQEKKNSTIKLFKEAKIRAKPNFSIGLLIYKVDNSIQEFRLFCVIDSIPIAKGCEKNVNKLETQKCFSAYISNHFSQNIDLKKYIKLGAKKKTYRTLIKFKINKNSKISDINIQCDSEIIKQDLYNITKSINIIEPGRHNGIPVIVNFGFPLTFKLE